MKTVDRFPNKLNEKLAQILFDGLLEEKALELAMDVDD
jgi:hypothetical protein